MTTIDMLRARSIRDTVTRAAGIDPEPIRSRGVTRWTAQARRALSPAARRAAFAVRNLPAGITPGRAADLMEATAADARELKRRAGIKGWAARVGYPALVVTFYWDQEPPPNEPAVIREAIDVIRADELQAAILRGADDDGPCTIVILNTVHPLTGRVHRARPGEHRDDIYLELMHWHLRREGVPCRGVTDLLASLHLQHLWNQPDRTTWYRELRRSRR